MRSESGSGGEVGERVRSENERKRGSEELRRIERNCEKLRRRREGEEIDM